MGVKGTTTRDLYAKELRAYIDSIDVSDWPLNGQQISKSGLATVMKERGLKLFDRKRLESSACQPLIAEMNEKVKRFIDLPSANTDSASIETNKSIEATSLRQRQRIAELEKELQRKNTLLKKALQRCGVLEGEVAALRQEQDAFQTHCISSLRTLHAR